MPSDLYDYENIKPAVITLKINGKKQNLQMDKGYAVISRRWNKGDKIEISLPMEIRRVLCNENVKANRGLAAIERGPVVFCAEGVDNGGSVANIYLPDDAKLKYTFRKDLLNGVGVITAKAKVVADENGKMVTQKHSLMMVPYYAWSNRGVGPMKVWMPPAVGKKSANPHWHPRPTPAHRMSVVMIHSTR
jgi:hypothetical protein